jgi:hypothetical protein
VDGDQPTSPPTTDGGVRTSPERPRYVTHRTPRPRPIGLVGHLTAAFVDFLMFVGIVTPLLMLVTKVVAAALPESFQWPSDLFDLAWWFMIGVYLAADVLFAATPGKRMVSLRIRMASGARASRWRLFLRWCVKILPLPFAALYYNRDAIWHVAPSVAWKFGYLEMLERFSGPSALAASFLVFGGLFLALLPGRRPLHDRIVGTALFATVDLHPRQHETKPSGFEIQPVTTTRSAADLGGTSDRL